MLIKVASAGMRNERRKKFLLIPKKFKEKKSGLESHAVKRDQGSEIPSNKKNLRNIRKRLPKEPDFSALESESPLASHTTAIHASKDLVSALQQQNPPTDSNNAITRSSGRNGQSPDYYSNYEEFSNSPKQ